MNNSLNFERMGGYALDTTMLKRFTLAAVFFITSIFLFAPRADAQWKEIQQFPAADGYISASYFFNPNVGLIGFHWNITTSNFGMVQRTTDGGKSWTKCTVPVLNNVAPIITDSWFRDSLNGWLTFYNDANLGDALVWHSSDGGSTWLAVTALIVDSGMHGPTCVRQTPNAVTVTEGLGVGVWTSTDSGLTWTKSHAIEKSGIDFEDNNNGIITEYGEKESSTFLITTDGGLNWNPAPGGIHHSGWGVYAIKHGRTFVAAPEDTTFAGGAFNSSPVLRSVDNGQFWTTQVAKLPMRTTGDVEGVDGVIYIQNSGSTGDSIINPVHGLMRSIDSGQTWIGVGGPNQGDGSPIPITTTRFSVTGCGAIVYASDGVGGLWKTVDGGDSNSIIPQCEFVDTDAQRVATSVICDTERELYYLHNTNPNPGGIVIESLSIVDSGGGLDTTAVYLDSVPVPYYPIQQHDSVAFGLAWHPGAIMDSTGSDSVTIRVIYFITYYEPSWGLNPYDTIYVRVSLQGLSTPADFSVIPKSITRDTLPLCHTIDTIIDLINKGCDSLAITSAQLAKNNWTLTNAAGNVLTPPINIGPGDTLRMRLRAAPISAAILLDSLEVKMRYEGHDSSFGAGLRTSAKLNPLLPALTIPATLNFDSLATCDTTESPFPLANTGCDTITITQADLASIHFVLLDTNGNPLKLPLVIPTDSTRLVHIRFIPISLTTSTAPIKFHYKYLGFDSSNIASLTGSGAPSGTLEFTPSSLDFKNVSI